MNRSTLFQTAGMLFLAFALTGCLASTAPGASQPTLQPASGTPAAATAQATQPSEIPARPTTAPSPVAAPPTAVPSVPTFGFAPQNGGPGTRVALDGWNFAPGKPIVVRLGMPNPVGEVLVAATADAAGKWNATLIMPDRLPSGEVITQRELQLVVMNDANVALASAPFSFAPAASNPIPPREAAAQTVHDLLKTYQSGGDPRPFLSADLRARLDAGEQLQRLLGIQPDTLVSFDVHAPLHRPADALFIPTWLVYSGTQVQREFTVVLEQNSWRVAGSSEPIGELPVATPDPATQAWQNTAPADVNGDGVTELIRYRTGQAKIGTPAGYSDPSIVTVIVAEEIFVQQGDTPASRTLLYLNPIALNAEHARLLRMSDANQTPSGFVMVVYGGDRYSYSITPLAADGTPHNQSVRVVWSDEQGAYVLG